MHFSPSPGRRFGLGPDVDVSHLPDHNQLSQLNFNLDLNQPPLPSQPPNHNFQPLSTQQPSTTLSLSLDDPNNDRSIALLELERSNWSQGPYRIRNGYCVPLRPFSSRRSEPSPPSTSVINPGAGTLASLVAQGWAFHPPGPDEPGPSNWVERTMASQGMQGHDDRTVALLTDTYEGTNTNAELPGLQNINTLLNDRFRISPPLHADIFNPLLQVNHQQGTEMVSSPSDDEYSPTSPLLYPLTDSDADMDYNSENDESSYDNQIVLGFPCTPAFLGGKRRRDGSPARAYSAESFFLFSGTEDQIKHKKRKKQYEEWDAKGAFNILVPATAKNYSAKTITDLSMARELGVEPGPQILSRKRPARVSPLEPSRNWNQKRSRTSSPDTQVTRAPDDSERMTLQLTLTVPQRLSLSIQRPSLSLNSTASLPSPSNISRTSIRRTSQGLHRCYGRNRNSSQATLEIHARQLEIHLRQLRSFVSFHFISECFSKFLVGWG
ncbi:hypothetical protein BVRB_8g186060 isoform A [Beta vulgaris subsp. vulgaris]|nr:hypothetical protein BVRB_8g186060 isoform A [Beta vulgaris subsp. vulgaris]